MYRDELTKTSVSVMASPPLYCLTGGLLYKVTVTFNNYEITIMELYTLHLCFIYFTTEYVSHCCFELSRERCRSL